MPLLAYIHEPDESEPERRGWEPDWHVWGPAIGALVLLVAAGMVHGVAGLVLVLLASALGYRAIDTALPYRAGLRDHKQ
ncbi:MAG: hypothetical protein JW895_14775 [Thermoleophilaceae bacterium]|nr:hypothetical protein [Thermoleophilaceae bacterium]